MKPRLHMDSLVSCSGNSLITCEKVLSGAKCCARKAFAVLFCFCFISFSVFAVDDVPVVTIADNSYCYYVYNGVTYYPFNDFPATFDYNESLLDPSKLYLVVDGGSLGTLGAGVVRGLAGSYVDFMFSTGHGDLVIEPSQQTYVDMACGLYHDYFGMFSPATVVQLLVDGVVVDEQNFQSNRVFSMRYDGTVERYFTIRFLCQNDFIYDLSSSTDQQSSECFGRAIIPYPIFTFNETLSVSDHLTIITGKLDGISNTVSDIDTNIESVMEDVQVVRDVVSDTSEQLQNPNSNIWQAAGEKISDTIKEVFVPSEEEMQAEKQELEHLLADKLGDAEVLFVHTESLVNDIRDLIGHMDAGSSVHFPGISLPMNGETYVIVPEQDVEMNNSAFLIFQSALGMGITVLCWWSILHLCEDLLYCLISGVSYWGFIRSRHDK